MWRSKEADLTGALEALRRVRTGEKKAIEEYAEDEDKFSDGEEKVCGTDDNKKVNNNSEGLSDTNSLSSSDGERPHQKVKSRDTSKTRKRKIAEKDLTSTLKRTKVTVDTTTANMTPLDHHFSSIAFRNDSKEEGKIANIGIQGRNCQNSLITSLEGDSDQDCSVAATSTHLTSSTSSAASTPNQTSQSPWSSMQQLYTSNRQTSSHNAPSSRLQGIGFNFKSCNSGNIGTGRVKTETTASTGAAYYRPGWASRQASGFGGLTRQQLTPQKPHIASGMIPPHKSTTSSLSPDNIEYDASCKVEEFDEFVKDGNVNNTRNEGKSSIVESSYDKGAEVVMVALPSDTEENDGSVPQDTPSSRIKNEIILEDTAGQDAVGGAELDIPKELGHFKNVEMENKKSDTQVKAEGELSIGVKHRSAAPVETSDADFCCGGLQIVQEGSENEDEDLVNGEVRDSLDVVENMDKEIEGCTTGGKKNKINDIPTAADGSLPFYLIDMFEDNASSILYMFGKVWTTAVQPHQKSSAPRSCCVVVKKLFRNVYFRSRVQPGNPDDEGERNGICKPLFQEVDKIRKSCGIKSVMVKVVLRNYAFERAGVPRGNKQLFLKVVYPFSSPTFPTTLTEGTHFSHVFGSSVSGLERVIVKRRLYAPCWIKIRNFSCEVPGDITTVGKKSWCNLEVTVEDPKDIFCWHATVPKSNWTDAQIEKHEAIGEIAIFEDGDIPPPPPMTVMALSLKTVPNKQNQREICIAACNWKEHCRLEEPDAGRALRGNKMLGAIRKLRQAESWPRFAEQEFKQNSILPFVNERALITVLLSKIQDVDPDIIVGHNIYEFDLEVISSRLQQLNMPFWHKMSRLKRNKPLKKQQKGFARGVGRMLTIGRIVCDTYMQAKELLPSRPNYTLQSVVSELYPDMHPPERFPIDKVSESYKGTANQLKYMVLHAMNDAVFSFRVMWKMQALPLTRELTNLAGNSWHRSLQNARAERNEYLLLHRFHEAKFITPDPPLSFTNKSGGAAKSANYGSSNVKSESVADDDIGGLDESDLTAVVPVGSDVYDEDAMGLGPQGSTAGHAAVYRSQKATYTGGLVLEPKVGLYDTFVLLLDFNSLYPSIIQEYNVCFTTANRPDETSNSNFDVSEISTNFPGILPVILKNLVERRKSVKQVINQLSKGRHTNEETQNRTAVLNIRQLALKLTANSIYGCLGFANSRFYASPLAAFITKKGREILQHAKRKVEDDLHLDVIYGDTDSIMINTGLPDDDVNGHENFRKALEIGAKVKELINKDRKKLEIDIECVFRRLLLLKKKKYASVKVIDYEKRIFKSESKGIDIVRRDWCGLTKDVGNNIIGILFGTRSDTAVDKVNTSSGQPTEGAPSSSIDQVVEDLHDLLRSTRQKMDSNEIPLEQYVITKALAKLPHQYADAKSQPHVFVAKRLQELGNPIQVGLEIPYVICKAPPHQVDENMRSVDTGNSSSPIPIGMSERAFHPDEVNRRGLEIDVEWYKNQQLLAPITRLCGHVNGTSRAQLAECLGLDGSRFAQDGVSGQKDISLDNDKALGIAIWQNPEELYSRVRLTSTYMQCVNCHNAVVIEDVLKLFACPSCLHRFPLPIIVNWLRRHVHKLLSSYLKFQMICEECGNTTQRITLKNGTHCPQTACFQPSNSLRAQITPNDVLLSLEYLAWQFRDPSARSDVSICNDTADSKSSDLPNKRKRRSALTSAFNDEITNDPLEDTRKFMESEIKMLLQRNLYNQLHLKSFFSVFIPPLSSSPSGF